MERKEESKKNCLGYPQGTIHACIHVYIMHSLCIYTDFRGVYEFENFVMEI